MSLLTKIPQVNYLVISISLNLILFLLYFLVFTPFYFTPNDWMMQFAASGKVVFTLASPFLMHSHVWIGKILTSLYKFFPNIEWYPIYLIASSFIASTVIFYSFIVRRRLSSLYLALFLVYFLIVSIFFLWRLQYTTIAFQVALSGILLFWSLNERANGSSRLPVFVLPISLCLWAFLIRSEPLIQVLIIALPLLLIDVILKREYRRNLVIFIVVTLVLSGLLYQINQLSYQSSPGWSEYLEFNRYKQWLNDYAGYGFDDPTRIKALKSVGWSQNDLAIFQSWFFADTDTYSLEKLRKLVSQLPPYRADLSLSFVVKKYLDVLFDSISLVLIAIVLSSLALVGGIRREDLSRLTFLSCWLVLLIGLLAVSAKLPPRVYIPMISFLGFLSFWFANDKWCEIFTWRQFSTLKQYFFLGLLGSAVTVYLVILVRGNMINLSRAQALNHAIAQINPQPSEVFFSWGSAFPYRSLLPFNSLCEECQNLELIHLGTSTMTPLFREKLKVLGIVDVYTALRKRENLFLIIKTDQLEKNQRLYKVFMQEHYGINVNFETRYQDRNLTVVRVLDEISNDSN